MVSRRTTVVRKVVAYVTRGDRELLVFDGPEHAGLQVPKGTVEPGETSREALFREVAEESGLGALAATRHLASDVWERRADPQRLYVRHFYRTSAHQPRDRWTHAVTGDGPERGREFDFRWLDLPTDREFALDLDDYLDLLE